MNHNQKAHRMLAMAFHAGRLYQHKQHQATTQKAKTTPTKTKAKAKGKAK